MGAGKSNADLVRGTRSYRVGVYNLALLTVTLLVGVPVFLLGGLNIISRSWFWAIIGAATLEALVGFLAVAGTLVIFQRKRIDVSDPEYIAAMMRHLSSDAKSVLKTGRLRAP